MIDNHLLYTVIAGSFLGSMLTAALLTWWEDLFMDDEDDDEFGEDAW